MIYTVTFNPSLDYLVTVKNLQVGEINRTTTESVFPGGKGINVALMLNTLGIEAKALGFLAGFSGREVERLLDVCHCPHDFIHLKSGFTRINVKISSAQETALNGQGPRVAQADFEQLLSQLDALQKGDILILSGNKPASMSDSIYHDILQYLTGREIKFIIDATGKLLTNTLGQHPFLIKPNNFELGEIVGKDLHTHEEIVEAALKLQQQGVMNVLVSLGKDGALLLDATGKVHSLSAPPGKLVNSVGAGDSMVAGFLAGYLQTGSYETALALAVSAGSATAFTAGLASKQEVLALYEKIKEASHENN
jgi:1-phosphofructokinase